MEALANLGINGKLLLAQVVNFAILLWLLKRYAYQPMLRMMDERSARIEKGLKDAASAEERLRDMEIKEGEVLASARAEAKKLLTDADAAAKKRDEAKIMETEDRVRKLLTEAESKLTADRAKMLEQAKSELADTVMLAVEKVLKEKMDASKEKELIEKVIKKEQILN